MGFTELDVASFTEVLASPAPVPGGGGASALIGALGIALGDMVGELTTGKKKYADVEEDIQALMAKAQLIRKRFLLLIDGDAEDLANWHLTGKWWDIVYSVNNISPEEFP